MSVLLLLVLGMLEMLVADININEFKEKFASYGFYRFSNLPAK
jgi:hypothetical protein